MRKKLLTTGIALVSFLSMYAGDLVTNTNQNVTFLRNPARDASTEIDAAYTNPAGLAFLKKDGFIISVNNQSAFQTRTITSTFAPFTGLGGSDTKAFEGKAQALVIPNLQAAYKFNKWVISANVGIVGGGGTLDFSKGLPSFESQVAIVPTLLQLNGIQATQYSLDSRLKGTSVIYGVQLGVTYKISDRFSAYIGGRASFENFKYEGYLRDIKISMADGTEVGQYLTAAAAKATAAAAQATGVANSLQPIINGGYGDAPLSMLVGAGVLTQAQVDQMAAGLGLSSAQAGAMTVNQMQGGFNQAAQMATSIAEKATGTAAQIAAETGNKELNCKQNGFGIAPIIGFDYNWNGLNIGVKYEFKSAVTLKNKTATNTTGVPSYDDGAETPYDIPAMLAIGAQYDIVPEATVSAGYHHFFDSDAKMAGNRQKNINGGVNEYLAGVEYRINKTFLVSYGMQFTNPRVKDDYMTDISFDINSYSVGLGGAINLTENIRLNLAYLFTNYYNRTINSDDYQGLSAKNGIKDKIPGTDVYSRTNKAFGIGLDFRF